MPRDGLSQYAPPPGTNGITNYTIESTKYNGFVADVTQDLNLPRPIVAGGTGANNAHDAMVNLSGEIAMQAVTNYDTFPFAAGSFWSAAGATAAPEATGRYSGICTVLNDGTNTMVLIATSASGSLTYRRIKNGGSWGAWVQQFSTVTDLDTRYVNVAGDTMTGKLGIGTGGGTAPVAQLTVLNAQADGAQTPANSGLLFGHDGGAGWAQAAIYPYGTAGAGGQLRFATHATGFDYTYADRMIISEAGNVSILAATASTSPTTGALTVAGGAGVAGALFVGGTSLTLDNGTADGVNLTWNSTGFAAWNADNFSGSLRFYTGSTVALQIFGTTNVSIPLTTASTSSATGALTVAGGAGIGGVLNVGGAATIIGDVIGTGGNGFQSFGGMWVDRNGWLGMSRDNTTPAYGYVRWDSTTSFRYTLTGGTAGTLEYIRAGAVLTTWRASDLAFIHLSTAYKPGGGAWSDSSDSRIKNEIGEYTRGLAEIAALRPIYYTFKGNDTDTPPEHLKLGVPEEDAKTADMPLTVPYPNSHHKIAAVNETRYAGLIAQEVEVVIPEMVTKRAAYIDGVAVEDLRDLDTTPLIFALINAVKELKAEVDALKAAP